MTGDSIRPATRIRVFGTHNRIARNAAFAGLGEQIGMVVYQSTAPIADGREFLHRGVTDLLQPRRFDFFSTTFRHRSMPFSDSLISSICV
jgi:hypothetical protein